MSTTTPMTSLKYLHQELGKEDFTNLATGDKVDLVKAAKVELKLLAK